ncbi:MAG: hypothetical protein GY714_23150 [Desulfobacterales bacterium]|nr:hypothetical protein [Desulfobacterales bacterium]
MSTKMDVDEKDESHAMNVDEEDEMSLKVPPELLFNFQYRFDDILNTIVRPMTYVMSGEYCNDDIPVMTNLFVCDVDGVDKFQVTDGSKYGFTCDLMNIKGEWNEGIKLKNYGGNHWNSKLVYLIYLQRQYFSECVRKIRLNLTEEKFNEKSTIEELIQSLGLESMVMMLQRLWILSHKEVLAFLSNLNMEEANALLLADFYYVIPDPRMCNSAIKFPICNNPIIHKIVTNVAVKEVSFLIKERENVLFIYFLCANREFHG